MCFMSVYTLIFLKNALELFNVYLASYYMIYIKIPRYALKLAPIILYCVADKAKWQHTSLWKLDKQKV